MPATCSVNATRIRSISAFSWLRSCMILAFASTTAVGSTNTVAPGLETSWITPPTSPRYSAFTGTTKRPLRSDTTASCKNLLVVLFLMMASSLSRIEFSVAWILRRTSNRVLLAVSAISSGERMDSLMAFSSAGWGVSA